MIRRVALVALSGALSCGAPRPTVAAVGALPPGVVARAGAEEIAATLVERAASERGVSPALALEALLDDAVAAQAARARGYDKRADVEWSSWSVAARVYAERAKADALAAGPPTDAEVAAATAQHWRDVDLPPSVRVVHAVVRRPKPETADKDARAKDLAARIGKAVADATSPDDFLTKANAVDHGDLEVVAQGLPPMTADGRVTDAGHDETMDPTFAAAALALGEPPATSGVVETPFGWHIIRVVERYPEHRVALEARRALFAAEIDAARARRIVDAAREERGRAANVQVSTAADALMAEAVARVR